MKVSVTHISVLVAILAILMLYKACSDAKRYKLLAEQEQRNVTALLDDVKHYKVNDSLSCAKVGELELSLAETKKVLADEMQTIKNLSNVNIKDMSEVGKLATTTEYKVIERLRDTTIHTHDTIEQVKVVEVEKPYYQVKAVVVRDTINIDVKTRDSLLIVETIKYKRFLGFLWKTKHIKSRNVDVVSKNPATTIEDVQWITIEK
jgi:hypothetical protein